MHTPPSRSLTLLPRERLDAVLAIWPSRWSPHTVAAAQALPEQTIAHLMPVDWIGELDTIEVALAPVVRMISPTSEPRIRCH